MLARPTVRVGSHEWGRMEWLVEEASVPGAGLSLALMVLNPGMATPFHRHPNCNEALTVLEGSIEEKIAGESFSPKAGETLYVSAGQVHGVRNLGMTEARMMVFYSEGTRIFEAVSEDSF